MNLGPFNDQDYSVIPTGSDIWAGATDGIFIVEDVKSGGSAEASGVLPGDQIDSIDGIRAKGAIEAIYGRSLSDLTSAQIEFGLNIALGGKRNKSRKIELSFAGKKEPFH